MRHIEATLMILFNIKDVYLNQPENKLVWTGLIWESDYIHVHVMVVLVHSGADVTTAQHEGNTALIIRKM